MTQLTRKLSSISFSDNLFEPLKVGDPLDEFISKEGGFMPATSTMIGGSPGAGKTTFVCESVSKIQEQPGKEGLFISCEMNPLDMASYMRRFPHWDQFDVYFPDFERDIFEDIKEVLDRGYDFVAIDSFKEVQDLIYNKKSWTKNRTERELLTLLDDAMMGENARNVHTAFLIIQQVLKTSSGGIPKLAGSKRLQHMMTANLKMVVDGAESFLIYDKNRRGDAHQRLYYEITEDAIEYDASRFKNTQDASSMVQKAKTQETFSSFEDLASLQPEELASNGSTNGHAQPQTQPQENGEMPLNSVNKLPADDFREIYENAGGSINGMRKLLHEQGLVHAKTTDTGIPTWHRCNKRAQALGLK